MILHVARSEDNRTLVAISSLAFALLLALVLSTPFVEMSGAVSEGQKSYRLYGYGLVGLLQVVLVLIRGWQQTLRIVSTPISILFVWCVLSLAWTQHLDLTSKRLVLLGLLYLSTFASIYDLNTQRSLGIVRIFLVLVLALNFAVAIAVPEIGVHILDRVHLWRGVMAHKNIAGMLCAIIVLLFAFDCKKMPTAGRFAVIAAALIFFFLAWSKTALISLPLALSAGGGVALIGARQSASVEKWRKPVLIGSLALSGLVLMGLIVATLQRDFFLSLTDDTTALTTRAAIWRPMIQFYLDHSMLGSGYGAYWDASADLIASHARDAGMWKNVDQGHNGYLDLLVQVGLPGLVLALYAAFVWPLNPLVTMVSINPQRAALIVALMIFFLVENFSESSLFADDALGNAFTLLALALTHRFALRSPKRGKSSRVEGGSSAAQLRERRQRHQSVSET